MSNLSAFDSLFDRFEEHWTTGQTPRIEDFLSKVAVSEHSEVLQALLEIEVELKTRQSGPPEQQEYLGRFPDFPHEVSTAFQNVARRIAESIPADDRTPAQTIARAEIPKDLKSSRVYMGPFRLLQFIDGGGMGDVYMAEQTEPIRRKVAVKVVQPERSSKAVLARFDAERQALALMNHPSIAAVVDAGLSPAGMPWFAMELVKGVSITKHCSSHELSITERLKLFVPVCRAIQHAHQKGVIHRDIKPSNVLVAMYDDRAVPKVIDFGLAKAIHEPLTKKTLFTEYGRLMGTWCYMAPEQAKFNAMDVDTRCDVYSLGVLLYELLTGSTPLTEDALRNADVEERLRMIREDEPPSPSTRISDSTTALLIPSMLKNPDLKSLALQLRGDLDCIVLKCLQKDRDRRYETPEELARDIEAFLDNRPVNARPDSIAYRFQKLYRRKRLMVNSVAAIVLTLIVTSIFSTGMAIAAMKAKAATETALTEKTDALTEVEKQKAIAITERDRARMEADVADEINRFLNVDLLWQASPEAQADRSTRIRDLLDSAAVRIADRFTNKPAIEAAIQQTLGNTYRSIGEFDKAELHLLRSLELRKLYPAARLDNTLTCRHDLAVVKFRQGNLEAAESLHRDILAERTKRLGPEHPDSLMSKSEIALAMLGLRRFSEAEQLLDEVLARQQKIHGFHHDDTIASITNLGLVYHQTGRFAEAEQQHRQALDLLKQLHRIDHPRILNCTDNLALALMARGKSDEAESLFQQLFQSSESVLGPKAPATLQARNNFGRFLLTQQRFQEAAELYDQLLPLLVEVRGAGHVETLTCLDNFAQSVKGIGDFATAEAAYRQCLEAKQRFLGDEDYWTQITRHNLAQVLLQRNLLEEAESLEKTAMQFLDQSQSPQHTDNLTCRQTLAKIYLATGRTSEARKLLQTVVEGFEAATGPESRSTTLALFDYATALSLPPEPKLDESTVVLRTLLDRETRRDGRFNADTQLTLRKLALNLYAQQEFPEAERLAAEAIEWLAKTTAGQSPLSFTNEQALLWHTRALQAACWMQQGKVKDAEQTLLTVEREFSGLQEVRVRLAVSYLHTDTLNWLIQLCKAKGDAQAQARFEEKLADLRKFVQEGQSSTNGSR